MLKIYQSHWYWKCFWAQVSKVTIAWSTLMDKADSWFNRILWNNMLIPNIHEWQFTDIIGLLNKIRMLNSGCYNAIIMLNFSVQPPWWVHLPGNMNLTRAISVSHCSERKKAYLIWDLQGRYSKKSCAQISSSFLLAQKQRVICMSVCIEITRGSTAHTKPKCFKNTQEILNYKSFIEHLNLYLLHRMLLFVYPFLRTLSLPF